MADFGKLNFSVSFNPTTAFPLDARSYFESLDAAKAAASAAVEIGSASGTYYIGQSLVVVEGTTATMYVIQPDKTLAPVGSGSGGSYVIGSGLKLDPDTNTLSVDTATEVDQDNTKPITSAAVFETVGNIEILLGTI